MSFFIGEFIKIGMIIFKLTYIWTWKSERKNANCFFVFHGNIFTKLMYNSMKKVILFSIVAILVGCQSQKNLMLNNQWKLTELNGKNLTGENVEITLTFNTSNHQVNGNGGCNRYFGGYKLIDNTKKMAVSSLPNLFASWLLGHLWINWQNWICFHKKTKINIG